MILYHRTKLALEVIPVKLDDFTMNVNGVGGERLLLKNVARASESSAENSLPALCNPLSNAEACERTVAVTEARARVGYPTLHRLSIFCMTAMLAPMRKSKKAPPLMGAPLLNISILFWGAAITSWTVTLEPSL